MASLAAVALCTAGCLHPAPVAPPRLHGAFIQYNAWMTNLDEQAWQRELDAMRRAGLRLVIIHNPQVALRGGFAGAGKSFDPTGLILRYADRHGMQVFLGLESVSDWWHPGRWRDLLESHAAHNRMLADELWQRYGAHRSLAGWYLPQELWDGPFSEEQLTAARRFFRDVGAHCRSLSPGKPKPVAISPFFSGAVPPEAVERLYRRFLGGAGVDILMLQDGVGARGWEDHIEERVIPYFEAMARACRANGVEFWINVESFMLAEGTPDAPKLFLPARPERFRRQLRAAAPFARRLVTFEFLHYLSPHRDSERARRLYDEYRQMGKSF